MSDIYKECSHCVKTTAFEYDTYICDLRPDDLYFTDCTGCRNNMKLVEQTYLNKLAESNEVVLKMRAMPMKT